MRRPVTRVLVVDDQPAIRAAITRALQGRRVSDVESAESILHLLAVESLDAIVTDYDMSPGMTGAELLPQLATLHPGIRRFLMTGMTPTASTHWSRLSPRRFFPNPISPLR
jgi:DNA-binding NtrC family response regulator